MSRTMTRRAAGLLLPTLIAALALGCDERSTSTDASPGVDAGRVDGGESLTDAGPEPDSGGVDAGALDSDAGPLDVDSGSPAGGVTSSLTITCDGALTGRAIVNFNGGTLGVAFTDPESPFTSRGSISFGFPAGFSGPIANPEIVDGGPRHTLAITDRAFTTYGNHCWPVPTDPQSGAARIDEWRPSVTDVPLRNCVSMSDTCVLDGVIETTGQGVFD